MFSLSTVTGSELRRFGFLMASILIVVFGTLLPYALHRPFPLYWWIIGTGLATLAWLAPFWLRPLYCAWMTIGHVLGWINTRILLGIVFFALITPIGFIFRLFTRDPLGIQYDASLLSYRKTLSARPIQHMEKPF